MENYRLGAGSGLHLKNYRGIAAWSLVVFFVLVFAVAIAFNPHYAVLVFIGEASVGTWMSGLLLISSAIVSMILGLKRNQGLWFFLWFFFFSLALDERFMFHEQAKEHIIFSWNVSYSWVHELPVIAGACIGVIAAFLLWKNMKGTNLTLMMVSVLFGTISVFFDLFSKGVIIEEICKLLGELLITCSLLCEIEKDIKLGRDLNSN